MSDNDFAFLDEAEHAASGDVGNLRDNVVRDYIEYSRGNIIANEEQFALGALAKVTAYLRRFEVNVNDVKIGPSSGGKSHFQHALGELYPTTQQYSVSDGSKMSIVDDNEWDHTVFAFLDEWNKIPDKLTEIIKSTAGEDLKYTYGRSESTDSDDDSRETEKYHTFAKPFDFLYAQFQMDNELWNRLLKLYVDDDERIHRAIGKKEAGHTNIKIEGFDNEYIFDTDELESDLYVHHNNLETQYVELEGDERLLGDEHSVMPPIVWYIAEPIFDHGRTETNRIYGMVFNLMRASSVTNKQNRRTVEVSRSFEGDNVGTETVEAQVVNPQDVANILSAYETLLGTTHELERRKRVIVNAIRNNMGLVGDDGGKSGCTIDTIQEYLERDDTHASTPKKDELRDILQELEDNYIINIDERGAPNSSAHLYQFRTMKHIAPPRVSGLTERMSETEIEQMDRFWPDVDLDDPFGDTTDPYRDQPFKETVRDFEDQFGEDMGERAERAPEVVESEPDEQSDLAAAMGGSDDTSIIENPLVYEVYSLVKGEADGETYPVTAKEHHLLGIAGVGESISEVPTNGTIFDPHHDVWGEWFDFTGRNPDEVSAVGDASARIKEAFNKLEARGIINIESTGGDNVYIDVGDADYRE